MKKRAPCFLCAVALGTAAALAPAQKSHDALAQARAKATAENQRVLLLLRGGESEIDSSLLAAMANYRKLGKLIKYDYQLAAQPAAALAATHLRKKLELAEVLALPTLVALDTDDGVLGVLDARAMVSADEFGVDKVRGFLEQHVCTPLDANEVLGAGILEAKKSKRQVFVYLSAPW